MVSWLQKISSGNESGSRKEKMMKRVFQTLAIRSRLNKYLCNIYNKITPQKKLFHKKKMLIKVNEPLKIGITAGMLLHIN